MCTTLIDVLMYANIYHDRYSFASYVLQIRRICNHGAAKLSYKWKTTKRVAHCTVSGRPRMKA